MGNLKLTSRASQQEKQREEYYINKIKNNERIIIPNDVFLTLPDDIKKKYVNNKFKNGQIIYFNEVDYLELNEKEKESFYDELASGIISNIPNYYKGYKIFKNDLEGSVSWENDKYLFYATPFWDDYNHIPISYYHDKENDKELYGIMDDNIIDIPEKYKNIINFYHNQKGITNREIFDFIGNFYLPIVYENIKRMEKQYESENLTENKLKLTSRATKQEKQKEEYINQLLSNGIENLKINEIILIDKLNKNLLKEKLIEYFGDEHELIIMGSYGDFYITLNDTHELTIIISHYPEYIGLMYPKGLNYLIQKFDTIKDVMEKIDEYRKTNPELFQNINENKLKLTSRANQNLKQKIEYINKTQINKENWDMVLDDEYNPIKEIFDSVNEEKKNEIIKLSEQIKYWYKRIKYYENELKEILNKRGLLGDSLGINPSLEDDNWVEFGIVHYGYFYMDDIDVIGYYNMETDTFDLDKDSLDNIEKILSDEENIEEGLSDKIKSRAADQEKQAIEYYTKKIMDGEHNIPNNIENKLSDDLKLKYIENRINKKSDLSYEQFIPLSDDLKLKYINSRLDSNFTLSLYKFNSLSDDLKLKYIEGNVNRGWNLENYEFDVISDDLKLKYLEYKINRNKDLTDKEFDYAPNDLKLKYIENKINTNVDLTDKEFNHAPNDLKLKYIENKINRNEFLYKNEFDYAPDDLKIKYLENKILDGKVGDVPKNIFNKLNDNLKLKYIENYENLINKNSYLSSEQFDFAPDNIKLKYIKKRIKKGMSITNSQENWYNEYKNTKKIKENDNYQLNETNSELEGKEFVIPGFIKEEIKKYQKEYGMSSKRSNYLLKQNTISYYEVKRLKNFFDKNSDGIDFYLAGGLEMKSWIENILNQYRGQIHKKKETLYDIGLDNQFKKTHTKNKNKMVKPSLGIDKVPVTSRGIKNNLG